MGAWKPVVIGKLSDTFWTETGYFCYLFFSLNLIQTIKIDNGKSHKLKLVLAIKEIKFYFFIYWFAEIELHSDSKYLKNIFPAFHWIMYYASFTSKNNHLSSYHWAWCTSRERSLLEQNGLLIIFDIQWRSHTIQTICSWQKQNRI